MKPSLPPASVFHHRDGRPPTLPTESEPQPAPPGAARRAPLRLVMTLELGGGVFDAAWWPQSRDLVVEFADLTENLPEGFGRVVNLAYWESSWDPSPTWLPVGGGRFVHSRIFPSTADPHRVLLRLDSHRSLDMLVVPPDLDNETALRAMEAAASPSDRASALTLVAEAPGTQA